MAITIIVAHDQNLGIGKDNKLPWGRIDEDMKWFKEKTWGRRVLMGRKTFESIGKVLPGRENYVLTGNPNFKAEGVIFKPPRLDSDFFVIGGADVYRQYLNLATHLVVTEIRGSYNCDAFFPAYDKRDWRETSRKVSKRCTFITYERRY